MSLEELEAHLAGVEDRHELERIRTVAQFHVYHSTAPREVRLAWAKLSLAANERGHGDDPGDQARMHGQEFALRTWVIGHLGPDTDPAWNPETLAEDTLTVLSLDPSVAESTARDWPDLPIEEIVALRRHKNLTAHVERLMSDLPPGLLKEHLATWAAARRHLP
ncbi:hypothetical protein [Kitasatospora sp. MMS16-BH015]|uniref:hypothetical protein n=1 Tax=Kitasatospora sp. MMS16-BH015 TaxID=2018025 RepID=UPI0020C43F81|nr:hypothetical protein [Kitasatospora sp. MMS16-BH015]